MLKEGFSLSLLNRSLEGGARSRGLKYHRNRVGL